MARGDPLSALVEEGWPLGAVASGSLEGIPAGGVSRLFDGIWPDDGMPERRGGSVYKSGVLGSGGPKWIADKRLAGGQRTAFANTAELSSLAADDTSFFSVDVADVPTPTVRPVVVAGALYWVAQNGLLVKGWGGSRKAVYATGTATVTNGSTTVTGQGTAWLANVDPGAFLYRILSSAQRYLVEAVVSDTSIRLAEPFAGATVIGTGYSIDPVSTVGPTLTAPVSALGSVAGRLVLGVGPQARFSSPPSPTGAAWDLTNYHLLPAAALGFGNIRDTLIAFTTEGTYAIYNMALNLTDASGNVQQRIERINDELVLWGQFGLANWRGSLVVPMLDGVYLLDAVGQPAKVSGSFEDVYLAHVRAGNQPGGAAVFNGHYLLPILNSAGVPQDLLTCRLTPNSAGRAMLWSQHRGHGGGGNVRGVAARAPSAPGGTPLLLAAGADGRISTLRHFEPQAAYKGDGDGVAHSMELQGRALATGGNRKNSVTDVKAGYSLVDAAADNPTVEVSVATEGGSAFAVLAGAAPKSAAGQVAGYRWRVNKLTRLVQFRVRTVGAAATAKFRSVEARVLRSGGSS